MSKISMFLIILMSSVILSSMAFAETTKLMKAVDASEPSIQNIKDALAAEHNINAINNDGETALMIAAQKNKNIETINYLIQHGANVNLEDEDGCTALMKAAHSNAPVGIIKALLNAGANVNSVNEDNETALIMAAKKTSDPEVIIVLLKAKANISIKNNQNKTAWDYAQKNSHLKDTEALKLMQNHINIEVEHIEKNVVPNQNAK